MSVGDVTIGAAASERRKRGRPVGDREAKIGDLLAAAREVIAAEGYAGASLRKVAERAGCSTGPVTYYFASKDAMIAAVAEGLFDEFDAWFAEGEAGAGIRGMLEKVFAWTASETHGAWAVAFQLLIPAANNPALARIVQRRYARLREALARLIETGQAQGVVRRDLPAEILSDQINAMSDGWMMMLPLEPQRFAPERLRELVSAVMVLIGPPSSSPAPDAAQPL